MISDKALLMFRRVAYAGNVDVYMYVGGYVSFFSSHYTPHINGRAVDITNSTEFGDEVLSPVSGVIEGIRKVEAPPGRYSNIDHIIALRLRDSRYRAKLMHLKPTVSLNEYVEVGDPIGRYIRTNYFSYHHLPHVHLEICKDSTLRPSRAIRLRICEELLAKLDLDPYFMQTAEPLRVSVTKVGKGYLLCKLHEGLPAVPCSTSKLSLGLINGQLGKGLCYTGYIHLVGRPRINEKVTVTSSTIGYIKKNFGWYSLVAPVPNVSLKKWFLGHDVLDLITGSGKHSSDFLVVTEPGGIRVVGVEFLISEKAQLKLILESEDDRPYLDGCNVIKVKLVRRRY